MTMLMLTLLTAAAALVFLGVLAWGLVRICALLDSIGGTPTSYLAKLRFGLRAIDKECSHLAPQVTRINAGLGAVSAGLGAVHGELAAVAEKLAPRV
jgi:hypothetical protein